MTLETPKVELQVVNGLEIYTKDLPPTKWYVGDVLHEGVCLLSGDPKVGKSFLALQIAIAIAGSAETVCGAFKVGQHGRVLYLALDDGSERRIHERLHQLTEDDEAVRNIDFVYQRDLPRLSQGLDSLLDGYLDGHPYALVILDTLGAALEPTNTKASVYRSDYSEAIRLQKLAQKHQLCLLVIHHTNKGMANDLQGADPVKRASGSHGLTGAVDSVMLLIASAQGGGSLIASPRDGEKGDYSLARLSNGAWEVDAAKGMPAVAAPERKLNPERLAVRYALVSGPKDRDQIAAELNLAPDTARKRLERMERAGLIEQIPDGRYQLKSEIAPPLVSQTVQ